MNAAKLVGAFIRRKPLTWAFHALALALGVSVITALVALNSGLENRFSRDLADINLVVGAKGSPMQLILSSVFQLDAPTGNIPLGVYQGLTENMLVKRAVPISLGDNVAGFRIIGTTPQYGQIYQAQLREGRWWTAPMEAVIGSRAEAALGYKLGQTFVGDHGLAPGGETHKDSPYKVVGILKPTGAVIDGAVLTDTASVWKVHEKENAEHAAALAVGQALDPNDVDRSPAGRQVTAVLVTYRSAMGALMLPRMITAQPNLQAAVPAVETARLTELLGTGADVLRGFGIGLLALSALGFFVALFAAVSQRHKELALLRALGARPLQLFALIALEGLALGVIGGVIGIALGRAAARFAASASLGSGGPQIALPPLGPTELAVLGAAAALSFLASIGPGLIAYRLNPASALRE